MSTFPPTPKWLEYYTEEEFRQLLSSKDNWPDLQVQLAYASEDALRYWQRKFGIRFRQQGLTKPQS